MRLLPAPGPDRGRQLAMLGAAVLLLLSVVWYQFRPTATGAPASNSPTQVIPQLQALKLPEAVKLDELTAVPDRSDVGRNPFGFGVRPAPPPPPPVSLPPVAMTAPPPSLPPVPQGPPPIALKLTGLVQTTTGGRTMVTLKDPTTGTQYLGVEGEVLDGRYRVVKVGLQSVVLSYVDGSGQRTIPLER